MTSKSKGFEITEWSIETIFQGALMKISGTGNPDGVVEFLKEADVDAKFRTEFWSGGGKRGFQRDAKSAKALVIVLEARNGVMYAKITAESPEDGDLSINVSKDKSSSLVDTLRELGVLTEKTIDKLEKVNSSGKGTATAILAEKEQFTVKYTRGKDDTAWFESAEKEAQP